MNHRKLRCVLHVGAHRTGTTLLQEFMFKSHNHAKKLGIHLLEIEKTRNQGWLNGIVYRPTVDCSLGHNEATRLHKNLSALLDDDGKVFLSDENIIGTMEENWWANSLYPDVKRNLMRLGPALELFDAVCLTVRSPLEWWWSCYSYLAQSGYQIENIDKAISLSMSSVRCWCDVVEDIATVMPNSKIVFREFNYFTSNPKRVLRDITGWNSVKEFKNIRSKVSNSSAKGREILKRQHGSAKFLSGTLFSEEERRDLRESYEKDLEQVRGLLKGSGRFLVAQQSAKASSFVA